MKTLFDKYQLSNSLELPNRVIMAPMTRVRATKDGMPTPSFNTYYTQRATAGLIIGEGFPPSQQGISEPCLPGLYRDDQQEAWTGIVKDIHDAGGRIFAQLMHGGRISHIRNSGLEPIGPSAIAAAGEIFTLEGQEPFPVPRAMTTEEVTEQIGVYVAAAKRAIAAGFDGVELHGANGYLIQQFISENANQRTDQYGGSMENRARFPIEVATAVADAIGPDKLGIRFSPAGTFQGIKETDSAEIYPYIMHALNQVGIAYVHILQTAPEEINQAIRAAWKGTLIVNPAVVDGPRLASAEAGQAWLDRGADLISFGRYFISNPDLVERFKNGWELTLPDGAIFYEGGDKGYIDYPAYADQLSDLNA